MKNKGDIPPLLDWLLEKSSSIRREPLKGLTDWKKIFDSEIIGWSLPIDRAIIGGFVSDRVAYAFVGGYESALRLLVPELPMDKLAAICVTEEGGAHPRAIKSRLDDTSEKVDGEVAWVLNGEKKFITCAEEAQLFIVVASTGIDESGKNRLRLVIIDRETPGTTIVPMETLPFVPEISHGRLQFRDVVVKKSRALTGDGYINYIKPFRTIEDIHVFGAILGHLFRIASLFDWPYEIREELLSLLVTIRTLASLDPLGMDVHIALGGLFSQMSHLLDTMEPFWDLVDKETTDLWQRDRALMDIAGKARALRLSTAWKHYSK